LTLIDDSSLCVYVPPFDHELIWRGNSFLIDELADEFESQFAREFINNNDSSIAVTIPDCIIASVGGGGLLTGLIEGAERNGWFVKKPNIKFIAVETIGANCFNESVKQNRVVTLDAITSIAKTLGAKKCADKLFEYYLKYKANIESIVLSDAAAVEGTLRFLDDHKIFVEPSCGVSLALAYKFNEYFPGHAFKNVLVIVCGGTSLNLSDLLNFKNSFNL
jgi:L-serine/L-threonine ammonia-lyase